MKVEVKRNNVVEKTVKFPLIAENIAGRIGMVVLFLSEFEGIVIKPSNNLCVSVGYSSKSWVSCYGEHHWRILQEGEQLILSNTFE